VGYTLYCKTQIHGYIRGEISMPPTTKSPQRPARQDSKTLQTPQEFYQELVQREDLRELMTRLAKQ